MLDRQIFQLFESCSPGLIVWISAFVAWTTLRIARSLLGQPPGGPQHFLVDEAPGLPLALLHSVAFVMAAWRLDPASLLLFAWWGPGFVITATIYIRARRAGRFIDWRPVARATSLGCKVGYLIFMIIYGAYGMPGPMFVFSLWIMHDQVRLCWFSRSADRTRRTFEDRWLVRILYPGLLLTPLFAPDMPLRAFSAVAGLLVLCLWIAGLVRVRRGGTFFDRPGADSDNLRDIVYLPPDPSPARSSAAES